MYGKPTQIYEHQGGVEGIAKDLKQMLMSDLSNRLNIGLYNGQHTTQKALHISKEIYPMPAVTANAPKWSLRPLSTGAMKSASE